MFKQEKGVTLVALVITIIVLLILAGVSIAMISGQDGILTKAQKSAVATAYSDAKSNISTAAADALATYYDSKYAANAGGTTETISESATAGDYIQTKLDTRAGTYAKGITLKIGTKASKAYPLTLKYTDGSSKTGSLTEAGSVTWND